VTLLALIAAGKNLAKTGAPNPSSSGSTFGTASAALSAVLVNAGQSVCLTFDTASAAYTFKACIPGGFNLSGTGKVQTVNNVAVLTDTKPDRRVVAYFYLNQLTGHATVTQIPGPGIFNSLSINSTAPNPTCGCP
jgi:hypothetical protein